MYFIVAEVLDGRSDLFSEEAFVEEPTLTTLKPGESMRAAATPSRSGRSIAAAIVGFVLLYATVASLVWWKSGKPPFPPPTSQPETAPV